VGSDEEVIVAYGLVPAFQLGTEHAIFGVHWHIERQQGNPSQQFLDLLEQLGRSLPGAAISQFRSGVVAWRCRVMWQNAIFFACRPAKQDSSWKQVLTIDCFGDIFSHQVIVVPARMSRREPGPRLSSVG
jgi:hypothetical protein